MLSLLKAQTSNIVNTQQKKSRDNIVAFLLSNLLF
jgi:hypothetical protein